MSKYHRYQLVSPIVGSKIYQAKSYSKGAKKCYEELKGCRNQNFNEFTVVDLDDYQTYKFALNKMEKHKNQRGGDPEDVEGNIKKNEPHDLKQISELVGRVDRLEKRIDSLSKLVEAINENDPVKLKKATLSKQNITSDRLSTLEPKKITGSPSLPKTEDGQSYHKAEPSNIPVSHRDVYKANLDKLKNM